MAGRLTHVRERQREREREREREKEERGERERDWRELAWREDGVHDTLMRLLLLHQGPLLLQCKSFDDLLHQKVLPR